MTNNLKTLLGAIGNSIFGLLIINIGYFLNAYFKTDTTGNFSFSFKNGIFILNRVDQGFRFTSSQGIKIMLLIFIISLLTIYLKKKK